MSRNRPRTTARMKVNCLLQAVFDQFGVYLRCRISGEEMKPEDPVEFDHTHALVHDGPHSWRDLRPVLKQPHLDKTKQDVRDAAHVNRLVELQAVLHQPSHIASSRFPEKSKSLESSNFHRFRQSPAAGAGAGGPASPHPNGSPAPLLSKETQ